MGAFSLFCFWPIIPLLLLAPCINILWSALAWPRRVPREPACGRCGYPVAGLAANECPECGADWRRAGVSTPWLVMRHRGSTAGAIFAWTALALTVGVFAASFIGIATTARRAVSAVSGPQTWTTPLYPNSKTYKTVDIATTATIGGMSPGKTTVVLTLTCNDGSIWTMNISQATGTATTTPPSGPTATAPFGAGSIAVLYTAAGLASGNAQAEAAELQRITDIELMSPYTQPSQMSLSTFVAGSPSFSGATAVTSAVSSETSTVLTYLLIGLAVWLAIYILGVWLIRRRRRKLLGSLDRPRPADPALPA